MDNNEDITVTFKFDVAVAALASIEAAKDRIDPDRVEYKQRLYDAQKIFMDALDVT
mgnify:FL=1|jgi:hypothetical protein|tara:strand:+ start:809 stop:976 length:168 start_codon:yes stop_codon:yes gene_type:complete